MASDRIPTDIAFEESYVLALHIAPYVLQLSLDLLLTRDHPAYSEPAKGERACFRRGTLRISDFRNLQWDASGVAPAHDASGETDWGCLDEIGIENDNWRLAGDWGVIKLEGGRFTLTLD